MQPLIGSELSRTRAEELRAQARPAPRPRPRRLRRALGTYLVEAGVRLLGTHRVSA